jgi:hypothetical protein
VEQRAPHARDEAGGAWEGVASLVTVQGLLVEALRRAASFNRHEFVPPRVVLWPDGDRLWASAVDALVDAVPEMFVLGPAAVGGRRGPDTWLRYRLSRPDWGSAVPVVYLPGVERQAFRSAQACPASATHLFALQFQGQFWTQQNGKDWTPFAFLTSSEGGLGLQVARDRAAADALQQQLGSVLAAKVSDLRGRHLEASDFHKLVTHDPHGMVLQWIGQPDEMPKRWGLDRWRSFVAVCQETFGFDPEKDGRLVAVEALAGTAPNWQLAWQRFREAPKSYAGVRQALDLVQPKDLLDAGNDKIPAYNKSREDELRVALKALAKLPKAPARDTLAKLAADHLKRADSVWGDLGEAPLASAAAQLGILAERVRQGGAAHDWATLAETYVKSWWQADAAAWKALAAVRRNEDLQAVSAALRAVYLPWLEELAERTEAITAPYPNRGPATARDLRPSPGTVVVFVDGLRCDLGLELARFLEGANLSVDVVPSWSALPTVTATAKPAWRPMTDHLGGDTISETFDPHTADGKALKAPAFRNLLAAVGLTWLDKTSTGDSNGSAWTEAGAFDRYGHDDGVRLTWRIEEELRVVSSRIQDLLAAGWRRVLVTSDHGWLLMPGGLPSVQLPKHLTESKWGRCALAKDGANHGFREVPWFWGASQPVVLAPGISTFRAGTVYAHGGLSVQEALTAFLTVTSQGAPNLLSTRISSVRWAGLRAQVQLEGDVTGVSVDLRLRPADPSSSLLGAAKAPDEGGRVSLVVENDDLLGSAAVVVALRDGSVVAKQPVAIGDN